MFGLFFFVCLQQLVLLLACSAVLMKRISVVSPPLSLLVRMEWVLHRMHGVENL